jgi:hypothetical protein
MLYLGYCGVPYELLLMLIARIIYPAKTWQVLDLRLRNGPFTLGYD